MITPIIKIFVVVSGLAVAELQDGTVATDSITIDIPRTTYDKAPNLKYFNIAPVAGDPDIHDVFHEHMLEGFLFDSTATQVFTTPFQLSITVPWRGDTEHAGNNLEGGEQYFPDLSQLHGGKDISIRAECKFSKTSLADCRRDKGKVSLLAAQINLVGSWTFVGMDSTEHDVPQPMSRESARVSFRSPRSDPSESLTYPFTPRRLADTLVFSAVVDSTETITIQQDFTSITPAKTDEEECRKYDPLAPSCYVIRLDNHQHCGKKRCKNLAWAADGADTHFLQLYRLTDKYDPSLDKLKNNLRTMMPVQVDIESTGGFRGGSSARCYPGVIH